MEESKTYFIFSVILICTLLIGGRLYYIQIQNGDYWRAIAQGQQKRIDESVGDRGNFFLENGNLALSENIDKWIVYVFPEKIENKEETAELLSEVFNQPSEKIIEALNQGATIKEEVAEAGFQKINQANNGQGVRGIYPDKIKKRYYPQGEFAASLIGFVNDGGSGQYGLEGYYDNLLKGFKGLEEEETSPFGYSALLEDNESYKEPKEGADIFLTIDKNIQFMAEKALIEAKEEWNIDSGQIIVSDPNTGKILALADFPSFDSNQYKVKDNLDLFRNRATQKLFEPGSVFKPITMAGALDMDLITPETTYIDQGSVDLGGPPIYNYQQRVWGEQTMTQVLENSINTGSVFVQQELGSKNFLILLEKFGLFEKTGIDLQGEEFSYNKNLRNGYPRDFATASFGQGIEITPIQLIRAFGAIANGGNLMKPYVVEKISKDGEEKIIEPEIQETVISEKTSAKLSSMLVNVIENRYAKRAKIEGYYIAGKTGTAQIPRPEGGYFEDGTIQNFIGYFPAMNPQALVLVKLDNPKDVPTAEYSAAPTFRKIAKYIIDYWQILPDYQG